MGTCRFEEGCGISGALKQPLKAKMGLASDPVESICRFLAAQHPFFFSKGTQISSWGSLLPLHAGNKSGCSAPPNSLL